MSLSLVTETYVFFAYYVPLVSAKAPAQQSLTYSALMLVEGVISSSLFPLVILGILLRKEIRDIWQPPPRGFELLRANSESRD